jgi:uncharacterized protein with GYD domain
MASYVLLFNYTGQGIQTVKDTTKRAAAAAGELAGKFGVKITDVLRTLGQYDGVIVTEAPNDEAMAAFTIAAASMGNTKTQTLRAFRAKEVDAILAKIK